MRPEPTRHGANNPEPTLVGVSGVVLEAFADGGLWWADRRLLVVADLHFEKGSSFARRGQMLPPYDTAETLARLARLIGRLDPAVVIALGDSFHDDGGAARLLPRDRAALARLQSGREWIWIAGNHDRNAAAGLDGMHAETLAIGPLVFRHEPAVGEEAAGEIAGHLHPAARVAGRGKWVRRRCFAGDGNRLVLPAFGAYAGGLNVLDRAFAGLFAGPGFRAFVLGEDRVYAVGRKVLRPD
ncbi:MAG: ligase-associated DNA damage response endonuclease PdeM [Bauldia sp.]|nr:ligase-associated DNA damage response endonuclease PdeM [Bauldia sp.]